MCVLRTNEKLPDKTAVSLQLYVQENKAKHNVIALIRL